MIERLSICVIALQFGCSSNSDFTSHEPSDQPDASTGGQSSVATTSDTGGQTSISGIGGSVPTIGGAATGGSTPMATGGSAAATGGSNATGGTSSVSYYLTCYCQGNGTPGTFVDCSAAGSCHMPSSGCGTTPCVQLCQSAMQGTCLNVRLTKS